MSLLARLAAAAALVLPLALGPACGHPAAPAPAPLTVYAAASLRAVVDEAAAVFEREHGRPVRVSYAASSTLARQIDEGAPADVMLSANARWIDWLAERSRLAPDTRRAFASNRLVLIAPAEQPFSWSPETPLADAFAGKLALGDPAHVPAGVYARQALERLGAWDALAPRVIAAADVRAALRFVVDGGAPAGIVYRTDAAAAGPAVHRVAELPATLHDPILYVGAAIATGNAQAAAAFLDWLGGPEGRALLARHGFTPPAATP